MPKQRVIAEQKQAVLERAHGCCEYCKSDDFTLVIGLTPIGRATIKALQLNREELVNLRRVLYAMGEHPPAESD
jgi:hypothetical protein